MFIARRQLRAGGSGAKHPGWLVRRATAKRNFQIPVLRPGSAALSVLCFVWTLMAHHSLQAQLTQPGVTLARSHSGQFVVHSVRDPSPSRMVLGLQRNTNFVRLDPSLLVVSCERIKQHLWRELRASDTWSGKIFIGVYPVISADDPITIIPEQFRDGWQYRVSLPSIVERSRYIRALVNVLLLEFANRNAADHPAELPIWLVEGLSEQLLLADEFEIILPPPEESGANIKLTSVLLNARKQNPLERAHQQLSSGQQLNFQQLSWPTAEQLSGASGALYRGSAQLLVSELLALGDGRACLREMLAELPRYYNWQFAFLHAFRAHFQRPIEIEKWWALHLAHFTGRELAQTWSAEESWQKLDQIIRSVVEVRLGADDLPLRVQVPLQTIIREWEPARQTQALQAKLTELGAARLRVAPEFGPLTDEYSQTITAYLQSRVHGRSDSSSYNKAVPPRSTQETIQRLDTLESRRTSLAPTQRANPVVQAEVHTVQSP